MRTVRSFAIATIAVAFTASSVAAQTAADIVAGYLKRVGGADRVQAIQSLRRTGMFYGGGGFEAKLVYLSKRPNKVREDFIFGGMTGINSYNGSTGWKIQPWQ